MIPKIIHLRWFSGEEYPKMIKRCLKSWKRHLPDYQIRLWDESNFDISQAPLFVRQAYNAKKWAFAADYIRCWALYNYGGVYLDTDVEVLRPLDDFLNNRLFIFTQVFSIDETKKIRSVRVNLSIGVIGCEKKHPYIEKCMKKSPLSLS